MDGYLYKKLDWAQILVAKSNVTMTIADSTMATSLPSLLTTEGDADVEQGRSNGGDPLEQRNVCLPAHRCVSFGPSYPERDHQCGITHLIVVAADEVWLKECVFHVAFSRSSPPQAAECRLIYLRNSRIRRTEIR